MLYTLTLYSDVSQLHLNKMGGGSKSEELIVALIYIL